MKTSIIFASAAAITLGAGAFAPASAQEVEIRNAVARVAVVVEDRSDVAVEVEQGSAGLPGVKVSRQGARVVIDGDLGRNAIRQCRSGQQDPARPGMGASAEVRDRGRVQLSDAPLIVIRTPRTVELRSGGAVFGSIGRGARSVNVESAGCGGWTVANVDGRLDVGIGGSGTVRAGTSRSLAVNIGGSGQVSAGATGDLAVNIGGSGDVTVARINGPFQANIGGSGKVMVRGGEAERFEATVAGSGDIDFLGRAGDVRVNLMGGGDIRIVEATGAVERNIVGGGRLNIGRQ